MKIRKCTSPFGNFLMYYSKLSQGLAENVCAFLGHAPGFSVRKNMGVTPPAQKAICKCTDETDVACEYKND